MKWDKAGAYLCVCLCVLLYFYVCEDRSTKAVLPKRVSRLIRLQNTTQRLWYSEKFIHSNSNFIPSHGDWQVNSGNTCSRYKVIYQDCVRVHIWLASAVHGQMASHCFAAKVDTWPVCQCSGFIEINEEAVFCQAVLMLVWKMVESN